MIPQNRLARLQSMSELSCFSLYHLFIQYAHLGNVSEKYFRHLSEHEIKQ